MRHKGGCNGSYRYWQWCYWADQRMVFGERGHSVTVIDRQDSSGMKPVLRMLAKFLPWLLIAMGRTRYSIESDEVAHPRTCAIKSETATFP